MRHRFLRTFAVTLIPALLSMTLAADTAYAQKGKKGGKGTTAAPAGGKKPPAGDIELDDPKPAAGGKATAAKSGDTGVTPTAGQMTEAAAKAKRDFNKGDWENAALGLYKVSHGETSDDEGNKQLAQFDLAIALYNKKFYQAAYGIFSEISEKPSHLKFNQTLLWLAKLATELPEPADIVERIGKYNEAQINQFKNDNQIALYWQLNYLLGRYKYRQRQYEAAIELFKSVKKESKYYIKSQFFSGISYVQLRKSSPAVTSFKNVITAIDEGVEGVDDDARMRDLAYLSIARTFYSASVVLDPETNTPKIDEQRLNKAVFAWNTIDVSSEYWIDGLFEEAWAYFMAGDYAHALGNVHSIQSPYFPNAFFPEAEILRSIIYFTNCQYDDAGIIADKFSKKYNPVLDELRKELAKFSGENQEEAFYKFLKNVRDDKENGTNKANLSPRIKTVVSNALSDRQLLRHIKYVELLDDEAKTFNKAGANFVNSSLGNDVKDALQLARDIAVRNAGQLARERYERNIDELNEHLRNATKISIDITAAKRGQIDEKLAGSQARDVQEIERNKVKADGEHLLWPFEGEYWRDELGFYRQTVVSKCAR
jgi:tetratricopeptide (TPR) repeat protein